MNRLQINRSNGRMLHFISSFVTRMQSSANVSDSVESTSPTTCANSLYSGSKMNSMKLRCAELCAGFFVNLRLWKMSMNFCCGKFRQHWLFVFNSRFWLEIHVAPQTFGKIDIVHRWIRVCVQFGKRFQCEADAVERTGKANVAQHRRHNVRLLVG